MAALVPLSQPHTPSQLGEPGGSQLSPSSRNPPCPHLLSFAFSTEPSVGTGRCHSAGSRTALAPGQPCPPPRAPELPLPNSTVPCLSFPSGQALLQPTPLSPGSR